MFEYKVKINPPEEYEDEFIQDETNIMRVQLLERGSKPPRIMLEISRNALLGLGTELIRLAHQYKQGHHTHMYPVDKTLVSQNMGVYLTPDSCEVIIHCVELGDILEVLKK